MIINIVSGRSVETVCSARNMKEFKPEYIDFNFYYKNRRKPDFNNILKILEKSKPDRPTLFEFFLNEKLYKKLAGKDDDFLWGSLLYMKTAIRAYKNAGYDYVTIPGSGFVFPSRRKDSVKTGRTISLNKNTTIFDRKSFEEYKWPDPDDFDYSHLDSLAEELPEGMKFIVWGPGGVLENVIELVGYDSLCFMLVDEPQLVEDIFESVSLRLIRYYRICAKYNSVGALISNDDWAFHTQTMLSVEDMRRLVVPWHKEIVETIHSAGKPAILHSCGQIMNVMKDIIDYIKYDAKHSYEDNIIPVENFYEEWGGKIAVLGGIDIDFLCRSTNEEIYKRSARLLEKSMNVGSYALGSGNSIPDYVPDESYLAMISAINAF